MVYLENAPAYEALAGDFAWEKTYAAQKKSRREGHTLRYLLSDAAKYLRVIARGGHRAKDKRFVSRHISRGRMLDVGCGAGHTIKNLPEHLIPYGVEISPVLAEMSHKHCQTHGGRVVCANALDGLDAFEDSYFDGIMMRAFLEHEAQPQAVLKKAQRVLAPQGRVIIKVPNYGSINRIATRKKWCGFRFPDHVNYFTANTLRHLVEQSGYRIVQFRLLDHFPLSDSMWMVIEKG